MHFSTACNTSSQKLPLPLINTVRPSNCVPASRTNAYAWGNFRSRSACGELVPSPFLHHAAHIEHAVAPSSCVGRGERRCGPGLESTVSCSGSSYCCLHSLARRRSVLCCVCVGHALSTSSAMPCSPLGAAVLKHWQGHNTQRNTTQHTRTPTLSHKHRQADHPPQRGAGGWQTHCDARGESVLSVYVYLMRICCSLRTSLAGSQLQGTPCAHGG